MERREERGEDGWCAVPEQLLLGSLQKDAEPGTCGLVISD